MNFTFSYPKSLIIPQNIYIQNPKSSITEIISGKDLGDSGFKMAAEIKLTSIRLKTCTL